MAALSCLMSDQDPMAGRKDYHIGQNQSMVILRVCHSRCNLQLGSVALQDRRLAAARHSLRHSRRHFLTHHCMLKIYIIRRMGHLCAHTYHHIFLIVDIRLWSQPGDTDISRIHHTGTASGVELRFTVKVMAP